MTLELGQVELARIYTKALDRGLAPYLAMPPLSDSQRQLNWIHSMIGAIDNGDGTYSSPCHDVTVLGPADGGAEQGFENLWNFLTDAVPWAYAIFSGEGAYSWTVPEGVDHVESVSLASPSYVGGLAGFDVSAGTTYAIKLGGAPSGSGSIGDSSPGGYNGGGDGYIVPKISGQATTAGAGRSEFGDLLVVPGQGGSAWDLHGFTFADRTPATVFAPPSASTFLSYGGGAATTGLHEFVAAGASGGGYTAGQAGPLRQVYYYYGPGPDDDIASYHLRGSEAFWPTVDPDNTWPDYYAMDGLSGSGFFGGVEHPPDDFGFTPAGLVLGATTYDSIFCIVQYRYKCWASV